MRYRSLVVVLELICKRRQCYAMPRYADPEMHQCRVLPLPSQSYPTPIAHSLTTLSSSPDPSDSPAPSPTSPSPAQTLASHHTIGLRQLALPARGPLLQAHDSR